MNIADIKVGKVGKVGNKFLPLEKDSCDIMESFGMIHVKTWKMVLIPMQGANRLNEDGTATARNACKVNGLVFRFEPIYVWKKI